MATQAQVEQQILSLENAIGQKDAEIDVLRGDLAQKDAQIASLQAQLAGAAGEDAWRTTIQTRIATARDGVRAI